MKYKMWKHEKDPYCNNRTRKQLVDRSMPQVQYTKYFDKEATFFRGHVWRIKEQYVHIKNTQIRICLGQIVIQMDFAEKFTALEFFQNIQGVHWAKNLVTIHTVVVYYLVEGVEGVQYKSFVYLSPVDQHNTIMVWAILKLLWQRDLPRFFKDQKIYFVHYVTDGPGSQYKNRFIFWMVANHPEMFGCRAVWHYLETGHGKGPCDGVGGSLKRNAQTAASAGVTIVCNAPTMYLWAKDRPNSSIQYCYVDVYDYWTMYYDRSHVFYRIPGLPGTRNLHSVMGAITTNTFTTVKLRVPVTSVATALQMKPVDGPSSNLLQPTPYCTLLSVTIALPHCVCVLVARVCVHGTA